MKKTLVLCLIVAFVLLQIIPALAQDSYSWKQFRGNNKDGISNETGLLQSWPEQGPELVWKKDIGTSFSELLVLNGKIYTLSGEKTDSVSGNEYAVSFDAKTGNQLWKTKLDSIFIDVDGWGDGARSTPVIGGEKMFCLTSYGKLIAVALKDGHINWTVDLVKNYESTVPRWGFSSSPTIIDDVLIVEVGGKNESAFVGFNPKTGEELWKAGTGQPSYCSPIIAKIDGIYQIIFANGMNLISFNAKGEQLWTYKMPLRSPTAVPVFIAPNKIFVSRVSGTGSIIVEVAGKEVKEVLNTSVIKNDWSSSVYYKGHIYGFNVAALQCVSIEDGSKKWTKRGYGKGSLILIDGKLLVLSDKGKLVMVEATPDSYKELSVFQAIDGKSWTAPSFVNGMVYLRNLSQMACYKLK